MYQFYAYVFYNRYLTLVTYRTWYFYIYIYRVTDYFFSQKLAFERGSGLFFFSTPPLRTFEFHISKTHT